MQLRAASSVFAPIKRATTTLPFISINKQQLATTIIYNYFRRHFNGTRPLKQLVYCEQMRYNLLTTKIGFKIGQ